MSGRNKRKRRESEESSKKGKRVRHADDNEDEFDKDVENDAQMEGNSNEDENDDKNVVKKEMEDDVNEEEMEDDVKKVKKEMEDEENEEETNDSKNVVKKEMEDDVNEEEMGKKVKKEMEDEENDLKDDNKKKGNKKKGNKEGNKESNKKSNKESSKKSKKSTNIKVEPNDGNNNNPSVFCLANYGLLLVKNLPRWHEIIQSKDEDEEQSDNMNNNMIKEEKQKIEDNNKKFELGTKKAHFTDTLITTSDNRFFGAHSLIVMAGSSRFKEMLISCTEQEAKYELTLPDLSGQELTWLLNYLYEGRVELSDQKETMRMEELVHLFGLITASSDQIVLPGSEAKDASVYDELRKGGVMKTGKGGKCLQCGRDFKQFSKAKRHYEVMHTKPDPSKFTCPICEKKHTHQHYLEHHLSLKHGIKKRDLKALKSNKMKEV